MRVVLDGEPADHEPLGFPGISDGGAGKLRREGIMLMGAGEVCAGERRRVAERLG
jgi:hypothetical protein